MNRAHQQAEFGVRFDWGVAGAAAVAAGCDMAVVVDVLSFTTTLSVALDAGITVLPYRLRDDGAAEFARRSDAALAVPRAEIRPGRISLSPSTIRGADVLPERLVLPSPNGSTISYELADSAATVVGASLRNARAVGAWIRDTRGPDATVAVIAAGERWPDESLRPAVEDLWGCGAVLDAIAEHGWTLSPEAVVARSAWSAVRSEIGAWSTDCASGRELIDAGYPLETVIAAEVDSSTTVPVLRGDRFTAAT